MTIATENTTELDSKPTLPADMAALTGLARDLQVDQTSGRKPKVVARLSDWQYLERSLHRSICGWGGHFAAWDDNITCHRQVWEQSECVRRLRERLEQFPGSVNNLELPVSDRLEKLANTVLLAPSFEDAVDGIYQVLNGALTRSYLFYIQSAHPVHDAPTVAMLQEIVTIKEQMRLWLRSYRRRHAHTTDPAYLQAIELELERCDHLRQALPVEGLPAAPAGFNTQFAQPAIPAACIFRAPKYDIMPFVQADFPGSIEARRLFWCYGYMRELSLAVEQLRWVYNAHHMPWEFVQDISRHLWDESRHGDSGHSRFLDFGITLQDFGVTEEAKPEDTAAPSNRAAPMTEQALYEAVRSCGLVAETGHFVVKREAYDDFKAGGDLDSAEMMLFDIIDETTHVTYAHKWLPLLAEHAGVDNTGYKEWGAAMREEKQNEANQRVAAWRAMPRRDDDPAYQFYLKLLQIMRERQPLSNAATCPPRTPLPM